MMKNLYPICLTTLLLAGSSVVAVAQAKVPESIAGGAPTSTPLWKNTEFFRHNPGTKFFLLASCYVPQVTPFSCSAASSVMVLNAARIQEPQASELKNISQWELVEKVKGGDWKARVSEAGLMVSDKRVYGIALDELRGHVEETFRAYGLTEVEVTAHHVAGDSPESRAKIVADLTASEADPNLFMLANFDQGVFTGDQAAGHYSPVGAYDAKKKLVLIMDVDREELAPYWVGLDDFVLGMKTMDQGAGKARGYLLIRTKPAVK